jgi:hypothetical protein
MRLRIQVNVKIDLWDSWRRASQLTGNMGTVFCWQKTIPKAHFLQSIERELDGIFVPHRNKNLDRLLFNQIKKSFDSAATGSATGTGSGTGGK